MALGRGSHDPGSRRTPGRTLGALGKTHEMRNEMEKVLKTSLPRGMNKGFALAASPGNVRPTLVEERKSEASGVGSGKRRKKRHDGPLGEQSVTEKRSTQHQLPPRLDRCKTQGSRKSRRQTEQGDGYRQGSRGSGVTSQALSPGEAPMGTLCAGKERRLPQGTNLCWWTHQEVDPLAAQEPHPLSSRLASAAVSPQERCRSGERSRGLDRAIG